MLVIIGRLAHKIFIWSIVHGVITTKVAAPLLNGKKMSVYIVLLVYVKRRRKTHSAPKETFQFRPKKRNENRPYVEFVLLLANLGAKYT